MEGESLRGSIHEILERRKDREKGVGDELKVTVSHIVHEVDVGDITNERDYRSSSCKQRCQQWYCKQREICNVFSKWMNHSCHI